MFFDFETNTFNDRSTFYFMNKKNQKLAFFLQAEDWRALNLTDTLNGK